VALIKEFRPTREEAIEEQTKLHYVNFSDLYWSPHGIMAIRTRRTGMLQAWEKSGIAYRDCL
jgi:hypothetical protein